MTPIPDNLETKSNLLGFPPGEEQEIIMSFYDFCIFSDRLALVSNLLATGASLSPHSSNSQSIFEEEGEERKGNEEEEDEGRFSLSLDEECPICMERRCDLALTCSHSLCRECFDGWIKENTIQDQEDEEDQQQHHQTPTCPLCRREFNPQESDEAWNMENWDSNDLKGQFEKMIQDIGQMLQKFQFENQKLLLPTTSPEQSIQTQDRMENGGDLLSNSNQNYFTSSIICNNVLDRFSSSQSRSNLMPLSIFKEEEEMGQEENNNNIGKEKK